MRSSDRARGRAAERETIHKQHFKQHKAKCILDFISLLFFSSLYDERKNKVADKRIHTKPICIKALRGFTNTQQAAIQNENKSHDEQKDHLKYDLKSKVTSNDF